MATADTTTLPAPIPTALNVTALAKREGATHRLRSCDIAIRFTLSVLLDYKQRTAALRSKQRHVWTGQMATWGDTVGPP
jgi:hypothetical protein